MKRIYVNEKWCLGCHLCEYECAFANSGLTDMVRALKGKTIHPKIRVEDGEEIHFAVSCRHCKDALCTDNLCGEPNCVKHCPNNAIVYEER